MLVRRALEQDRAAIKSLGAAMVLELTPHLTFDETAFNTSYDRALAKLNPIVFVADEDGDIVGFLAVGAHDYVACAGFYLQQELFYVRPDKRGSRAAASLFAGFLRWAQRLQPEEIFAGIGWGRRSAAAARWLKRFGFEPAGQQVMRRRMGG